MYNEKLNIDDLVKQSLEGFEMDFDEQDWGDMESMLDQHPDGGKVPFWAGKLKFLLGGLFLLMLPIAWSVFNSQPNPNDDFKPKQVRTTNNSSMTPGLPNLELAGTKENHPNSKSINKINEQSKQETMPNGAGISSSAPNPTIKTFGEEETLSLTKDQEGTSLNVNKGLTENKTVIEKENEEPIINGQFNDLEQIHNENVGPQGKQERTIQDNNEKANQSKENIPSEVATLDQTQKEEGIINDKRAFKEALAFANPIFINNIANLDLEKSNNLNLTLTAMESSAQAFKIPLKLQLKHSLKAVAALNWNFTNKDTKEGTWGYQTGLAYSYAFSESLSAETGILWNESNFYSSDVVTPTYLWSKANSAEVKYNIVEVPVLLKYNFAPNKKWQPTLAAGTSFYIIDDEQYFFDTNLREIEEISFLNNYYPTVTSDRYTSDQDAVEISGRNNTDSLAYQSVSNFDSRENRNALLPSGEKTKFIQGVINIKTGFNLRLNRRNSLSVQGQFKTTLKKKAFDLKLGDHQISNFKNLNTIGLELGWNYRFG